MTPVKVGVPVEDLGAAQTKIEIEVSGPNGQTLLHWAAADPIDGNPDFVPAADTAPPRKPVEKMSVEELYLRGVEEEKDGQERVAMGTYQSVLERDPVMWPPW